MDKELLTNIDRNVDGLNIRNRSHAIEMILTKHFEPKGIKKAVILCGGEGSKLKPITYEIPKPLVPIHGRSILEHIFDLLKKYDIKDTILSVGYKKEKIKQHFGNGFQFGVNIFYAEEEKPLGTAGPLRLIRDMLNETFILSNGDELKDVNIQEMHELHKQKNALVTVALTTVKNPRLYGVASLSGSKILNFVEKPKNPPSNLINAGLYIIEPEVIDMIPEGFVMLEEDIFPKLAQEGRLFGFPFSGQWFDVGNIEKYEKVIKEWRDVTS